VFLLEILDPTCRCPEGNCLLLTFNGEILAALLSFSKVNKGIKINTCKELKNKWNFMASKAITHTMIKKIISLALIPQSPAS
jgi:hypothetical protein